MNPRTKEAFGVSGLLAHKGLGSCVLGLGLGG